MHLISCKDTLIDLSLPKVMGILNVTPDSFFDGGRYQKEYAILQKTSQMLEEGATWIDVGGYSSRPNATHINTDEEKKRVLDAIEIIFKEFPQANISVDTFRAEVAEVAVKAGACMVNDISGGNLDAQMFETVARLQVPYILMHMKGTPQTMTTLNNYEDILLEMIDYFQTKVFTLRNLGVKDIILDMGFGFAKNINQNFYLLKHLKYFSVLNLPILAGISRKSMIYKTLQIKPNEALNGTTVLHTIALLNGASILRVHDVKDAMQTIQLYKQYVE